MSKKLIAVAAAAALALTGLVAAPASANVASITFDGTVTASNAGITEANPIIVNVPSQNVLRYVAGTSSTTSASLVRVDVVSPTTNTAVRVTATGGVKLLTTAQYSVTANRTAAFGAQSLDLVSADNGTAAFYAYNTSTTPGSVTVVAAGNTLVRYIKGANAKEYAYNFEFTAPTTADVSGVLKFTGSITDIFGNKIEGLTAAQTVNSGGSLTVTRFGAASALATATADVWTESTTSKGTYTFGVTTSATAGAGVVGLNMDVLAVTGYTPKNTGLFQFTTASLASQVTALQAQVAALTAQLQATVTKAKYNKLVRKWNRANPNNKVKRVS